MEVIAQRDGCFLVWEGDGTPTGFDLVVVVDPRTGEGWRFYFGSILAREHWEEPDADAPSAEALLADCRITDVRPESRT